MDNAHAHSNILAQAPFWQVRSDWQSASWVQAPAVPTDPGAGVVGAAASTIHLLTGTSIFR